MEKTKKEQIIELITQWTRAEIMARFGRFSGLSFTDFANIHIEKENELRRLIFGTDDLVVLGLRWGLLKSEKEKVKADLKEQFKKLQDQLAAMEK